jgi:hypothetical protein
MGCPHMGESGTLKRLQVEEDDEAMWWLFECTSYDNSVDGKMPLETQVHET